MELNVRPHNLTLWKRKRVNNADTFSFEGGMSELIRGLAAHPGIRIRKHITVTRIERNRQGWHVNANTPFGEIAQDTTQLVMSTPANVSANLLTDIDSDLGRLLGQIKYAPLAVLHMGFDQKQIKSTGLTRRLRQFDKAGREKRMDCLCQKTIYRS